MKKKLRDIVRSKLDTLLGGYGFVSADDGLFYGRIVNGVSQAIIFSRTRYKDMYVVVCAIDCIDDAISSEDLVMSGAHRERLACSETKFCLSPVAPFQGSYDWSFADEAMANRSVEEIGRLVQVMCFPVLASLDSRQHLDSASNDQHGEKIALRVCSALSGPLSSFGYRLASDHRFLWKPNGEVNVILLPTVVGFGCFLILYVVLWSPLLMGRRVTRSTVLHAPPSDFSKVSFAVIGQYGITEGGTNSIWCICDEVSLAAVIDKLSKIIVGDSVVRWLNEHQTAGAMIELIHPDMRAVVRRTIDNSEGNGGSLK